MSDEAHFHVNSYGKCTSDNDNKNTLWAAQISSVCYGDSVVWHTFATVIRTYTFWNEQCETLRVCTETYWDILENFLTPGMHYVCMQNLWFQQNDTTSQTTRTCMDMLLNIFPGW